MAGENVISLKIRTNDMLYFTNEEVLVNKKKKLLSLDCVVKALSLGKTTTHKTCWNKVKDLLHSDHSEEVDGVLFISVFALQMIAEKNRDNDSWALFVSDGMTTFISDFYALYNSDDGFTCDTKLLKDRMANLIQRENMITEREKLIARRELSQTEADEQLEKIKATLIEKSKEQTKNDKSTRLDANKFIQENIVLEKKISEQKKRLMKYASSLSKFAKQMTENIPNGVKVHSASPPPPDNQTSSSSDHKQRNLQSPTPMISLSSLSCENTE
jgi:hypothetical protein